MTLLLTLTVILGALSLLLHAVHGSFHGPSLFVVMMAGFVIAARALPPRQ